MNVALTAEKDLCHGCGACVLACPREAVRLTETAAGALVPIIDAAKCNECGLCAQACPQISLEGAVDWTGMDPFRGTVLGAFCAQATDPALLASGQSGGAVTAILAALLEANAVDVAVVTHMPEDGTLTPEVCAVKSLDGVRTAQRSKYCPVPVLTCLPDSDAGRVALVGLPCHMHGLACLRAARSPRLPDATLTIGLFCDRVLLLAAEDYLIHAAGAKRADVASLDFRAKELRGWPGDTRIRTRQGTDIWLDRRYRLCCKDVFTPTACRFCFDKMNAMADIAAGDAWGVRADPKGWSVLLARTQRGLESILAAEAAGWLKCEPVDAEQVFRGQAVEQKRTDWVGFRAAAARLGLSTPAHGVSVASPVGPMKRKAYTRRLKCGRRLGATRTRRQALRHAARRVRRERMGRFCRSFVRKCLGRFRLVLGGETQRLAHQTGRASHVSRSSIDV